MVGPLPNDRFSAVELSPVELRAGLFGTQRPQDLGALRRALLADVPAPRSARQSPWTQPRPSRREAEPLLPTPREVLISVPAAQRLCEGHQRTLETLAARARRQRIGLAILLGLLAAASDVLLQQQRLTAAAVQLLVEASAGTVVLALGALAALWVRDAHRLARRQAERFLRGLGHGATLPADRIGCFLRLYGTEAAFTACYRAWRREGGHPATA